MTTTYALEQYRALIRDGYRFETKIGSGSFLSKRLMSYAVPRSDARAVRDLSNEADRLDATVGGPTWKSAFASPSAPAQ